MSKKSKKQSKVRKAMAFLNVDYPLYRDLLQADFMIANKHDPELADGVDRTPIQGLGKVEIPISGTITVLEANPEKSTKPQDPHVIVTLDGVGLSREWRSGRPYITREAVLRGRITTSSKGNRYCYFFDAVRNAREDQ